MYTYISTAVAYIYRKRPYLDQWESWISSVAVTITTFLLVGKPHVQEGNAR